MAPGRSIVGLGYEGSNEMTDERFAEWFEEAAQAGWPDAADFLAELREAGFEIFRPDEQRRRLFCEAHKRFTLDERGCLVGFDFEQGATRFCDISEWLYVEGRVPVGGDQ